VRRRTLLGAALGLAFVPALAATARFTRGVLWKVTRQGAAPSYVFGTIHLADPRVLELPPPVQRALEQSRRFAMETPSWEGHDWSMYEAAQFEDGRRLEALIGPEAFAQVRKVLAARGIPEQVIQRVKPWAALANLDVTPEGYESTTLDRKLFEMASARRMQIEALEGTTEHISVFEGIPVETQIAMLRHTLEHRDYLAGMIEPTLQAWLKRDLAGIHAVNERIVARFPAMAPHYRVFIRHLVDNRSVVMAHRLHVPLSRGGVFVAVGATHLYGAHGLLGLIEKQGYRLARVY
jgi:uncharacterized protein YbaP (TraB family)